MFIFLEGMDHLKATHKSDLMQASDRFVDEKVVFEKKFNEEVRISVLEILNRCEEELPNASTISYPPHLAQSSINSVCDMVASASSSTKDTILIGHFMSVTLLACSAAAYTASIQHFDEVNEQCKKVLDTAKTTFLSTSYNYMLLEIEIKKLNDLMVKLPVQSDIDEDAVGNELQLEMKRMDEAIRLAVEQIEKIQTKARESCEGIRFISFLLFLPNKSIFSNMHVNFIVHNFISYVRFSTFRLEVNETILMTCQRLMSAIMQLVIASRELQNEIVAAGKGGASPAEFYKRNHQWTEVGTKSLIICILKVIFKIFWIFHIYHCMRLRRRRWNPRTMVMAIPHLSSLNNLSTPWIQHNYTFYFYFAYNLLLIVLLSFCIGIFHYQ
uniref:I/LWEQ domain-containing protein n=1 Tax=Heterorhabditis bacteriophora TaxID=37862 RepID=A0A1I7WZI8_HETBA